MVFLQGYGVSPAFAARIYKRYGAAAIARVRENPYRLAFDVWGIGFLSADRLATALGIARDSEVRVEAGMSYHPQLPTIDMCPASTLKNCGISSRLYLRRNLPTRVSRGSFSI